jgi:hypothetical protein
MDKFKYKAHFFVKWTTMATITMIRTTPIDPTSTSLFFFILIIID